MSNELIGKRQLLTIHMITWVMRSQTNVGNNVGNEQVESNGTENTQLCFEHKGRY
jgi:hypothetical protein